MKMTKKILAMLLALIMVLGLVACADNGGGESTNGATVDLGTHAPETDPQGNVVPVTLRWYYRGNGMQKDTQAVQDRVNELLKEYPGLEHVSIELCCYISNEYQQAVTLDYSAEEQIDIVSTVNVGDWQQMAQDGYFLAIDNLLTDEIKAALPEWLLDLGAVNGTRYMIPNYQNAGNNSYFFTPAQYAAYTDVDALKATLTSADSTFDDIATALEEYLLDVRAGEGKDTLYLLSLGHAILNQKGTQGYPFSAQYAPFDLFSGEFTVEYGTDGKVNFRLIGDEAKEIYARMAEWYKKGYIHPDALTIKTNDFTGKNMLNDVAYVYYTNGAIGDEAYNTAGYESSLGFPVVAMNIQKQFYVGNNWAAGGNAISSTCKNPEEAMLFLSAINGGSEKGKEIYNTIVYGLEGTHYNVVSEDRIETIEYAGAQGGTDTSYAALKWIMGNTFNAYKNQAVTDEWVDIVLKMNNDPKNLNSELTGFALDSSKVSTQVDNVTAIVSEYKNTLIYGVAGDNWETVYNEFVHKLETAGLNDILAEYQAQVDAFLKK